MYINHVTLNTGHIRKSYPDDVGKDLYFMLRRLFVEMFSDNGAEVVEGYHAKARYSEGNGVLITLFSNIDNVPILTTAIVKENNDDFLWELLHENYSAPLATNISNPPEKPYIADRMEIGAMLHIDALKWTGDFSRCMGWIYVDEKAIRG